MNSTRLYFIDAVRAFAILMMLQGHFIDTLLAPIYRDKTGVFALPMTTLNNAITNGNLASEELVFKNEKRVRF